MSDKTYPIFCPACDREDGGQTGSLMVKDTGTKAEGMVLRCIQRNHRFPYERLMALNPRKVKLQLSEKQPGNTISMAVWVYPEVQEALRQRYPQNLQTTLCALMTALADPDTVLIEGEHARALHATGVTKGREIVALGSRVIQLEEQLKESKIREKALAPILAALGQAARPVAGLAETEAVDPGAEPVDPTRQPPRSQQAPPARPAARQLTGDPIMDAMLDGETGPDDMAAGGVGVEHLALPTFMPKPEPSGR